ncbi:MAG TPA: hypothetical protein VMU84_19945 [Thermoanaerobaculia bacterium]|nr:hypothetical protein [Thermoanaerobaculia bacterium]
MTRKVEEKKNEGGRIRRVASKIVSTFRRKPKEALAAPPVEQQPRVEPPPRRREQPRAAKRVTRTSDIGTDVLSRTYTPALTSAKTSFRSDGSAHERDQELVPDDRNRRWNDEDRFTNKSGDPRIGTHGRTYEPGEIDDREGRTQR